MSTGHLLVACHRAACTHICSSHSSLSLKVSTVSYTHSCLQTEDAFYFLPSPYPEGKAVGAVKHTSAILEQSTRREVPLSEVRTGCPCGCQPAEPRLLH